MPKQPELSTMMKTALVAEVDMRTQMLCDTYTKELLKKSVCLYTNCPATVHQFKDAKGRGVCRGHNVRKHFTCLEPQLGKWKRALLSKWSGDYTHDSAREMLQAGHKQLNKSAHYAFPAKSVRLEGTELARNKSPFPGKKAEAGS